MKLETIYNDLVDIMNNDMNFMQYYRLHKKNAENEPYEINEQYYNIIYLKNVIDVLGTDLTVYQSKEYTRPMYLMNKDNELGLVLGIRKY